MVCPRRRRRRYRWSRRSRRCLLKSPQRLSLLTRPQPRPKTSPSHVKPQSPSQTLLLKSQRQARVFVKKAQKQMEKNLERANSLFEAETRVFDAKMNSLERAEKRKPKPSPVGQLQKAHKAQLAYERARHAYTIAKYGLAADLVTICERQIAAKDAKVRRLMRQLRVARRRAKRLRRGWSTTRVRFSLSE